MMYMMYCPYGSDPHDDTIESALRYQGQNLVLTWESVMHETGNFIAIATLKDTSISPMNCMY